MGKLSFLFLTAFVISAMAQAVEAPLPQGLHIRRDGITVSGVSSGGFMAVQFAVAHSSMIHGFASIAGGTYWCAENDPKKAQSQCMTEPDSVDAARGIAKARELAVHGWIDPLSNLKQTKGYIFSSPKDLVVYPKESEKLFEFSKEFIPTSNILRDDKFEVAHGMPTIANGNPCQQFGWPWIYNCNYDLAGSVLQYFYGPLMSRGTAVDGNLKKFAQNAPAEAKMFPWGAIYVPLSCAAGEECRLHIALHGCLQNADFIQDKFFNWTGFNEWAETNHLVVLYPQSLKTDLNPYGCWDWFGFTGENYVDQRGPQMKALFDMVQTLVGK